MRHRSIWIILILIGGMILLSSAQASESEQEKSSPYFDRKKEGWFWIWMKKPPATAPASERESVKAMRERADALLDRALEAPSMPNVKAYLAHQKKLLDRSEEVTRVWKRVLMEHPELDATVAHPLSAVGIDYTRAAKAEEKDKTLLDLAGRAGLLYFFSGACAVCPAQSALLASVANTYGFRVIPISIDGAADPVFPASRIDQGAAGRLRVRALPALFLVQPPHQVRRIGTGLLTAEEIADRLLLLESADQQRNDLFSKSEEESGGGERGDLKENDEAP